MSQNTQNTQNSQLSQNIQNIGSNEVKIISDEEMNFILLRAFTIIRERNEAQLLNFIKNFSRFRNARGENMFNFVNSRGNNIFMEACSYNMNTISLIILEDYNHLFKLGLSNRRGMTALMICIVKNMYDTALELLTFPNALPELTNDNVRITALDLMLRQNIRNNIEILVLSELIHCYLEYNPNSQSFHRNLDLICTNQYLRQILQREFKLDVLDFSKICGPIQQAQAEIHTQIPNLADAHNISYNTRSVTRNIHDAEPAENDQIAVPANDMNFDANDYTPEQFERLRLRKRGPPSGGKKKHIIKKTKGKPLQYKKCSIKKTTRKKRKNQSSKNKFV